MRHKFKTLLSAIALGLFLLIALATAGLQESTNTSTNVSSCEAKPPVNVALMINIHYVDPYGYPIVAAKGKLFVTHQKITDTTPCDWVQNDIQKINFTTDANGSYTYTTSAFTHDNEGDLFRAEVLIFGEYELQGARVLQVAKYDQTTLSFFIKELFPL